MILKLQEDASSSRVNFSKHQVLWAVAYKHSHKKRKDNLEGSLNQVLLAAELEFPKILVPRLPQHTSNVNTGCARKSKHLYSLCDQLIGTDIS